MIAVPVINLPREVLRWIQSLDLAYSVKNVKRDFANGFLVAEIFSRYYAKDIQMHSFDNGISAKVKKDNWAQLTKIFRKVGLSDLITEEEVYSISSADEIATITFVCKLFEVLTKRKVQVQVKRPTVGREPGYSKDTSLLKVRKTLHRMNLDDHSDIQTVSRVSHDIVGQHEKALQEDRTLDPERYSASTVIGLRTSQAMTKSNAEADAVIPPIRIKEIQVKQLDRNITHLRASKELVGAVVGGSRPISPGESRGSVGQPHYPPHSGSRVGSPGSPSGSQSQSLGLGGGGGGTSNAGHEFLADNTLSFLNACITRVINASTFPAWSTAIDPYNNFFVVLDYLKHDKSVDELLSTCLIEIGASSQLLANACAKVPKQFWRVADLFCSVIGFASQSSASFAAAVESFEVLGQWITQYDPLSSLSLFCDFALFKLSETVLRNANKRVGILRLLHAFSPTDSPSHVRCIKSLQATVTDMNAFIHCLNILARQETQLDELLLDLYLYYATIGLGMPSPKLRASAVSVLASFASRVDCIDLLVSMIPSLLTLCRESDGWWEMQASLVSFAASLIQSIFSRSNVERATNPAMTTNATSLNQLLDEETKNTEVNISPAYSYLPADMKTAVDDLIRIISLVLSSTRSQNVLRWAVVALAPITLLEGLQVTACTSKAEVDGGDVTVTSFCEVYIGIFEKLTRADRVYFLRVGAELQLMGARSQEEVRRGGGFGLGQARSTASPIGARPTSSSGAGAGNPVSEGTVQRMIELPSVSGLALPLTPVLRTIHPQAIARSVNALAAVSELGRLTVTQMTLVHAAVFAAIEAAQRSGARLDAGGVLVGEWVDIFNSLANFIFVGLCDDACSTSAVSILSMFLCFSPLRENVVKDSRLQGVLRLLYQPIKNADENCAVLSRANFESFLADVVSLGHPFNAACFDVLSQFSTSYPMQFRAYPALVELLTTFAHRK